MANKVSSKTNSSIGANSESSQSSRLASLRISFWLKRWREPLLIFLAMRVGLGLFAFFAQILMPTLPRGGTAPYQAPQMDRLGTNLLGIWTHWDGEWYLQIAQHGYKATDGTVAFFPLYPSLVTIVAFPLAGNYMLAGIIVAGIATLACFLLFYELCLREWDSNVATKAALYLAVFPVSFFLVADYSESLFLALTLGAFLAARFKRNWWLAALLAALATLTRSLGFLLIIPLAWEWWRNGYQPKQTLQSLKAQIQNVWKRKDKFTILWLVLPLIVLVGWVIYNGTILGDPLSFYNIQSIGIWDRHGSLPWQTVWNAANDFWNGWTITPNVVGRNDNPNLWEYSFFAFAIIFFLVGLWLVWRKQFPFSYWLFFAVGLIFPLNSPASKEPLLSFPRFVLVLFPLYIILALLARRWQWLHYLYLYTALLLLGLFFARFANWYWVA